MAPKGLLPSVLLIRNVELTVISSNVDHIEKQSKAGLDVQTKSGWDPVTIDPLTMKIDSSAASKKKHVCCQAHDSRHPNHWNVLTLVSQVPQSDSSEE